MKLLIEKFDNIIKDLKSSYNFPLSIYITCFILIYFILIPFHTQNYSYKIGDIAEENIKSPKDLVIYDKESTIHKIEIAKKKALPIFDFNLNILEKQKEKISFFFEECRKNLPFNQNKRIKFLKKLNSFCRCNITMKEFKLLEKEKFNENIEWILLKLISYYMEKGILPDNSKIDIFKNKGILIRVLPTNQEIEKREIYSFYKISEVKKLIKKNYIAITGKPIKPYKLRNLLVKLSTSFIKPNIHYNKMETEKRFKEIEKKIKPVYYMLKKNEIIVRKGSKITPEILTKLNALKTSNQNLIFIKKCFGIALLLILLSYILYSFLAEDLEKKIINDRDIFYLSIIILFSAIFYKVLIILANNLSYSFSNLSENFFYFSIPFAVPVLLMRIATNEKYSYFVAIFIAIFAFCLKDGPLFLYFFIGNLFVINRIKCCYERYSFIKVGLEMSIFNFLLILALKFIFIKNEVFSLFTFEDIFTGSISGFISAILVLGVIPLVERIFRYTTDLRLLELSNLEHPLLKEFLTKAPGSYQHSMLVGTLAEAAAKDIGVNSLLARVGSYYHDVGKIKKPLYFIENLPNKKENKHDKLSPHMSALILISHVKEGVELAEKYKLGDEIIDIIKQHHGTSLIKFFYKKALELKDKKDEIDEKEFRYQGPKPQTKEAGIVMLADVVEAASRTLIDPTPARLKGLVKNLIENIFNDGQLDECRLTLQELNIIKESFTKVLNSLFHQRIEYPKDDKRNSEKKD